MRHSHSHAILARALFSAALFGSQLTPLAHATTQSADVDAAFGAWNAEHGGGWRLERDARSARVSFLWGGSASAGATPRTDAEFVTRAREALRSTAAIHQVELDTLVDDGVILLPLANAGSTDKMSVRFRQRLGGRNVERSWVNVLLARDGALLAIDTQAAPGVREFDTTPTLLAADAERIAREDFVRHTGAAPTQTLTAELIVEQLDVDGGREPRLAWSTKSVYEAEGVPLQAYEHRVDAHTGAVLARLSLVHDFDVSGTVRALATPGAFPDLATNPPTAQAMPFITVTSAAGNVTADANGNFNIVGATAPLPVVISFTGPWCAGHNSGGGDYSLSTTLNAASGNQVLLNPSPSAATTAQANAYLWVNQLRNFLKGINPSDTVPDFQAWSIANVPGACNAYYSTLPPPPSINFFTAGSLPGMACVNMSYSAVVAHELGHWLNDRYGSGNGIDGMGEGLADIYAMYVLDSPIVGEDFCGTGCFVRSGLNTRQFCGDANPGCYGEVHIDGEPLMGALWKVRARLKTTLGASSGAMAANTLFSAWMNGYDDTQISTQIEMHWLALDDDDGNVGNGTPNFLDIDGGFRDQGFPGVNASLCNNVVNYCTSSTTSNGCTPTITSLGTPSASASSGYTISLFSVEGQRTGLIFYGISGRVAFPWIAGSTSWFCVKSPVQRTFAHSSGGAGGQCNGTLQVDWNNFKVVFPGALGNPLQAGQKVQAQGWFRDPPALKTTNLSNALEFTVCP